MDMKLVDRVIKVNDKQPSVQAWPLPWVRYFFVPVLQENALLFRIRE